MIPIFFHSNFYNKISATRDTIILYYNNAVSYSMVIVRLVKKQVLQAATQAIKFNYNFFLM